MRFFSYGYEFVVIGATDKNYEFYFDDFGHHNHCAYKRGVYGIDMVIGRILLNSTDRNCKGFTGGVRYSKNRDFMIWIDSEFCEKEKSLLKPGSRISQKRVMKPHSVKKGPQAWNFFIIFQRKILSSCNFTLNWRGKMLTLHGERIQEWTFETVFLSGKWRAQNKNLGYDYLEYDYSSCP